MSRALGKGLSALIPEKEEVKKGEGVSFIQTAAIRNNKFQPRTNYNEAKLNDLKVSIQEKGVLQPILVRAKESGYEVIAGERRLKAARALGLEEVPVIIKEVNDQEALVIALVENIQREELNAIEEAQAYLKLTEEFQYTHDEIAQSVGKNRSSISNFLRLLNLPEEIQKGLYGDQISFGHGRALLGAESTSEQKRLFKLTVKKGLSVRELENLVKAGEKKQTGRKKDSATQNPQIVSVEEGLQKILGTKVRIEMKKKRGRIIIDYYSPADLDRIVKQIIK